MAETNLSKNKEGYGYKYTDLAQIHEYLEQNNMKYYQYIERIDNEDYVMTVKIIDNIEQKALRGCRVVNATLSGKSNPAQEQGSALTYARRYSLLMAFGLATEDDDGESLTKKKINKETKKEEKIMENELDELVTEQQAKTVYAIMVQKGLNVEQQLQANYQISNTKDLTKRQYASILNNIRDLPNKK